MNYLADLRFIIVFLASSLACAAIIAAFRATHLRWRRHDDSSAVQSAHCLPTPRIGGVAVIAALALSTITLPASERPEFLTFFLALAPLFVAGLLEDLGWRVPPRYRMAASALSCLVAIALFGIWLPRLDIVPLDALMTFAPLAIAITVCAGAGICNAFNLIDGLNGLAAATAIATAAGLSFIALEVGDTRGAQAGMLMIAALSGFLMFNYPLGRIFLGDAGAYSVGFFLIWLGVYLMWHAPDLSGMALLLVFFWPVADTFLSIYRRFRRKRAISQPDRLHYHQLLMRALEMTWLGRGRRHIANPLATALLVPAIVAPVIAGVTFWNDTRAATVALAVSVVVFVGSYTLGIRLAPRLRLVRTPAPAAVPGE